jgi:hypothetical protein
MQDRADPWPFVAYFAALVAGAIVPQALGLGHNTRGAVSPGIVFMFLFFGGLLALMPFALTRLFLWRFRMKGLVVETVAGVVVCFLAWAILAILGGGDIRFLIEDWWILVLMGGTAGATYWAVKALGRSTFVQARGKE